MRNNPLTLRLLLVLVLSIALITSIVSAADPALHPSLSTTKNPVLSAAAINSHESPLSGQLLFSYGNRTQAWTLQTASSGWRARLFPARIAAPDSKKALLSTGGTKETRTGGNSTDPFAVIDEKLAPSEAAGLKSLIQNTLHAFSCDAATGDWYARNAANRITFTYTSDGTAKFSGGENAFGLTLLGIGRGDGLSPAGKGHVQADGRQLNITRPDYTEWYRNNDEGVEQGITIASRPAGSGLLQVGFGLTGDNSLSLKDTKTLILTDASGTPIFEYTGLRAFSSDGRVLPASLATDGMTLSWVVDDTGAVYPVTIDPVVVSASKAKATFTGNAADDYFGNSVALNSSGAVALVGAYHNDTAGNNAGVAYIFTMPAEGWSSKSASAATATFTGDAVFDQLGYSVALNSAGTMALVGARENHTAGMSNAGAAYIFVAPGGVWSGTTTSASNANATFTGAAAEDEFGNSVALNSTGAVALVGAMYNDTAGNNAGAAYIFTMPAGGWSSKSASATTATFTGGAAGDLFGYSVALNSTGAVALVGARENDTAGMSNSGAAYIFEAPGGVWSGTTPASAATATLTGGATELFGTSVALNSTGAVALVGAPYNETAGNEAGAAYIFTMPAGGWSGTTSASAATATFLGGAGGYLVDGSWLGDRFGTSVALSSDGTRVLIGAPQNKTADSLTGAAYIFTMPAGGWSGTTSASAATAKFTGGASGGEFSDNFGGSVALNSSGAVVLVGAPQNKTAGSYAGAAYIFQPPYVLLTATGITTGAAGAASVDGLKLNPTGALTTVDLYLGTSNTTITGTKVKTGIASLPVSVATTVDGVSLVDKTAGTYYLIACESGTTSILGATTSAVYTVTVPAIDGVIGFRWNTSDSSPRLYQIDSNGAVIDHNGTWFNDHLPWSGMKTVVVNASNSTPVLYGTNNRGDGLDLTGTYGDVMVEIPKFYTCSTYSNGNFSYWISPTAQEALHYTVAPVFNQRGTGTEAGTAAPYYYVGRYDANLAGSKLQSATGKTPNVDMTIGTARTYAENKGAGWGITNVWTLSALRQLFYTEMVTLDSQTAWTGSRGIVDTGGSTPSNSGADGIDAAIHAINATGNGTGLYGKTPVSYRGIENLWGNVWQFQDGFTATTTGTNVINATGLGLTGQATTFAIPLGVNDNQSVGALPTEGWQINLADTEGVRPLFLPSSVGGSDATYVSDYYYAPRSETAATPNILQSGGYCDDAGKAGVGALAPSDIASYTYAVVGARLEFRRILVPVVSFTSGNTSAATNTTSQGWAGVAPFSMVFNDTSTGTPINWVWSATNVTGNNVPFYINTTTGTLANISYEFKTAGNYTIKLNATNSLGSGISTQVTWVNVSAAPVAPVASFSSTNTSAATNTTSQGWAGVVPFSMVFTDTSTGPPTSWVWNATNVTGNNVPFYINTTTVTLANIPYEFRTAGNYTIKLNATNSLGSSISTQVTWVNVSAATVTPVASFSSMNTSVATNTTSQGWAGVAPFTMVFNDTSTNTPTSWKWGRNNLTVTAWEQFSTTNNATQAFVAGNWSVNLTATNSGGSGISGITWVNVSTPAAAPLASFAGTPLSGTAPLAVTFTDTSTGTPTSWNWVFGDGNTSTIQSPVFTYVTSGYFTVKLTAANAFGSNAKTLSQYISVAAVSRQNSTENTNITQTTGGGQTNVNVSTCDPGMTVTNTTTQVLVTNPALGWQKYTFDGANITKNTCYVNISVSNVTMDSTPFTAPLPGLGTVSTSLIIGQNQTTSGTLQQEIVTGANTTVTNAFQLAATNNGLTLGNIAYTLQIGGVAPFNRNLTASGVIINMSASHPWVLANGGTGAIKIFRYSDTGVVQMLPTTFVVTDAGNIDYFRATSLLGFSEFGLGGTSTTPGPSVGGGGDNDGPVSMVTPQQVPGTTKVNVGGKSAVTQVTINGTGISGAIVTGTVVSGPGLNTAPPAQMVYEYVDITPARYTTISEAVISFTVPVTWLTEHQLAPQNVVMYHLVGQTWVALPTTLVKVENGVAYYTAASPGLSRFAITGQAGVTSGTPLATRTPAGQTFGDLLPATAAKTPTPVAVTVRPVTTQTTAIPAASQPAPALPLLTLAIVGGVVLVLVAGGFLIRRWWIRRQNPALFRNYD